MHDELSAAIDHVVAAILDAADVCQMPVDAMVVANRLDLVVATDDRQSGRARFVRFRRRYEQMAQGSIFVHSDPRPERLQWAVSHEIGEAHAEQVFKALGIDPTEAAVTLREQIANQFASRLLLPTGWFRRRAICCDWDLLALKKTFSTASHELIARRMLDFELSIVIAVFDNGRTTTRQSNVLGRVPSATTEELACWQAARETKQVQRKSFSLGTIQAWPVHEPTWQREIVRWELSPDENYGD
jgi:Zn-dependent peptidase ImmA (M78 family)